jgi:hypothetical protein
MIGADLELKTEVMARCDQGLPWRRTRSRSEAEAEGEREGEGEGEGGPVVAAVPLVPELRPAARFAPGDAAGIREHLEREGYALVRDAASPAELERARGLLWSHLEGADCPRVQQPRPVGWRRGDPRTWQALPGPSAPHHVVPHSDAGLMTSTTHCDCLWHVRTLPGVCTAFASLLGTTELVCSYDRMSITLPTGSHNPGALRAAGTPVYEHGSRLNLQDLHVHHNRNPYDRQTICYGILNLFDASKSTGSTAIVPRSHVVDVAFERSSPAELSGFHCRGLTPCVVSARAGELLLIDSGTLHCGCPAEDPSGMSGNGPDELLRAACITCMHPARLLSPALLQARRRAYELDIFTGGSCLTEAAAALLLRSTADWADDRNVRRFADASFETQRLVDPSYAGTAAPRL